MRRCDLGVLLLCFLMGLGQIGMPPGRSNGTGGMGHGGSWISGRVQTKSGEPIPLAYVDVQWRSSENNRGGDFPGEVLKTKPDGFFRIRVPGDATYEVCAQIPGKPKQCKTVDVADQDLEIAQFVF